MKKSTFSHKFLLVGLTGALAVGLAATAQAASVSVSYNFNQITGTDAPEDRLAPSSVAVPNLTASSITKSGYDGPIIASTSASSPTNSFLLSTGDGNPNGTLVPYFPDTTDANNEEAEVAALNHYFQLTLTPAAGYVLDLSSLVFDYSASGSNNNRTFFVRYDHSGGTNNFAGPNLVGGVASGTTWATIGAAGNLDSIALVNGDAGESVTLRFFGYRAVAEGGADITTPQNLRYDNITIGGDLSAVPEPSAALLGALSALCLLRRKR